MFVVDIVIGRFLHVTEPFGATSHECAAFARTEFHHESVPLTVELPSGPGG
jgi:hypothetical protein